MMGNEGRGIRESKAMERFQEKGFVLDVGEHWELVEDVMRASHGTSGEHSSEYK